MAGPGNILIRVGAETGQAVAELSKVNRSLGDTMTASEKMHAGLKKAALPAAAALSAIAIAGAGAAKAAAEDAAAQEHLAGVLERTTGASAAQVKATEDWISSISLATGVADDELRPALEKIVTSTGDVAKSQKLMQAALDISAASGKDLDTVSTAIAKGYQGQTAALAKLVPGISKGARESKDFATIMGELSDKTGGAAARAADTATGQYKILTNQMNELQETLGTALLPVIDKLLPVLRSLATFASQNTTAITVLVGVVAALAAGILVANAALKAYEALQLAVKVATAAWTAAQWLLNAALNANPIGLVVVALTALGAALVVAYKHSETFRNVVDNAMDVVRASVAALDRTFDALKASALVAFDWITDHWKLALFAFGPIGAAVYAISENFDKVKAAGKAAADLVDDVWRIGRFGFSTIAANVQKIAGAFNAVAGAINGAIDAVQELIGWLGRIHVPKINLPGPFALPAPPPLTPAPSSRAAGGQAAPAGGTTINVYGAVDPEGTARAIRRLLLTHERRQGLTL